MVSLYAVMIVLGFSLLVFLLEDNLYMDYSCFPNKYKCDNCGVNGKDKKLYNKKYQDSNVHCLPPLPPEVRIRAMLKHIHDQDTLQQICDYISTLYCHYDPRESIFLYKFD